MRTWQHDCEDAPALQPTSAAAVDVSDMVLLTQTNFEFRRLSFRIRHDKWIRICSAYVGQSFVLLGNQISRPDY